MIKLLASEKDSDDAGLIRRQAPERRTDEEAL
jgi:hypothetical protein